MQIRGTQQLWFPNFWSFWMGLRKPVEPWNVSVRQTTASLFNKKGYNEATVGKYKR